MEVFGFDEQELKRAQSGGPPVWRVALWLVLSGACGAALFVFWLLTAPSGVALLARVLFIGAPLTVTVADVEVDLASEWNHPSTWRFHFLDITVDNHEPNAPDIAIRRLSIPLPALDDLLQGTVRFDRGVAEGLQITAEHQQPPKKWEPKDPLIGRIFVDKLDVIDASFEAHADPPLPASGMTGIYGELRGMSWQTGTRLLDGEASLTADRFMTGTLSVTNVKIPSLTAKSSDIHFEGSVYFGPSKVTVHGDLNQIHIRPTTEIHASVQNVDLKIAVENATGKPSPILGKLDADLVIHSGGNIPRGEGLMDAEAHLSDVRIPLGDGVSQLVKDLLSIAPYLDLNANDEVVLAEMDGRLSIRRGGVDLHELLYHAPRREIQVHGRIDQQEKYLVFRLVPGRNAETKAGFGLVVFGTDKIKVRIARKDELLPPPGVDPLKEQVVEGASKAGRKFFEPKPKAEPKNIDHVPRGGKLFRGFKKKQKGDGSEVTEGTEAP
jgi:hypothetical protein